MGLLNDAYIKAKELVAKKGSEAKKATEVDDDFKESDYKQSHRLPPGQYMTNKFPVLDLGYQPIFFEEKYRFEVVGEVENPISLTWEEVKKLPKTEMTADFHCVTKWSKFDIKWGGILLKDLLEIVKPKDTAKFVVQYGFDGYTTNVPLEALQKENVLLAYELVDDEGNLQPLPREHGGPMRMIIPQLYGWKGSKFLNKLEFKEKDELGFWEIRGYSNTADPWKEERYS